MRFDYDVHSNPHMDHILNKINSVHNLTLDLSKIFSFPQVFWMKFSPHLLLLCFIVLIIFSKVVTIITPIPFLNKTVVVCALYSISKLWDAAFFYVIWFPEALLKVTPCLFNNIIRTWHYAIDFDHKNY